jgi:hypothetical protein
MIIIHDHDLYRHVSVRRVHLLENLGYFYVML